MKFTLQFPIAIEPPSDPSTAWGGAVVDLPGCFIGGDTLSEMLASAPDVIQSHVIASQDLDMFELQVFEAHRSNKAYEKHLWAFVKVEFEFD